MIKLFFKNFKWLDWVLILISAGLIVLQVWLTLKLPEYMGTILSLVQGGGSVAAIWTNSGYMIACAGASLISAVIVGLCAAIVSSNFSLSLRRRVFNKVSEFSSEEINKYSTASLITRTTNDVGQVRQLIVFGLQILIQAPVMAIWAIVKISGKGSDWTLATGVAILVMLVALIFIAILVIPKFRKMQYLTDNLTKVARENLTGLPVVRAYNAAEYQEKKFEKANKELTGTNRFTGIGTAFLNPLMTLIITGMSLAIYWIGAYLINKTPATPEGLMQRGIYSVNMMTFMQYAMQVIMSFMMIAMMFIMIPRASVSARRVNEVLNTKISIKSSESPMEDDISDKAIEFRNVSFKYPGASACVIENISFDVKKGETVAIIGGTGSGKSTLINLIPRFFDVTEGEILLNGINLRDYDLEVLRGKVGYVAQKATLFSGSIKENIAYGYDEIDDERVNHAIKIAQAEFVKKMDGGLDADVSRGGMNLSGGQKQRISIARAIYKNPEIFVFDDSFSALDFKTDHNLRAALKKEISHATNFIVAQRIGTIMNADKIIVLESGRVVGIGQHEELLKNCKVYREIAQSQLSEEELSRGVK